MKGSVAIAMLTMITMAQVMVRPTEAISCGELTGMLLPCIDYVTSGGSPSENCCNGVRMVQGATQTQEDRQTACKCAKSVAGMIQARADAANDLPGKCGVSTSISIDPAVDCNTIP
ncbi:hypothetical protein QVD17_04701 [Tagetes erecta]|uniref:Non-specific lipid-transfer protein n=1 Tax=Tagetes erecta TaxID=13708 RepID=A0AAD8PAL5_TARER|nr:hypothetical protein QVD17_04701 [Tagetes erecta]